ncbi:hypothetical protein GCM10027413_14990 [Conyzicola nivalis]|uniref:SbsA Ig-like domain-containing protein n=1 Tax=Conyzicola nivalis TaxID=1477021 RepID=A0A916SGD7_9MICO|nr:hypothetical protein [Conyzicola nivalis]GGA98798.1 hypothetical protein GCM10010979_11630 [Conyzicola nivalis]
MVVLALLCAGFAALGYVQGPKLSSAQVDTEQVTTRSGQQLRLFANQPLAAVDPDDVTITPAAEFTVTTSGAVVAVQFEQPLLYDARYVVEVDGVTSQFDDQGSTLSYEFTTGSQPLYYLDRGEAVDEIVRTGARDVERTVVYSAPRIQEFALLGSTAAVSTDLGDGTSALSLVSFEDGGVEPLGLPVPGVIEKLHAADDGVTIGFAFSSADGAFDNTLMTLNLDLGRDIAPVAGLDGAPLAVSNWFFLPGGVTLAAHNIGDESVLLVDTASGVVTPLGSYASLESLSTDGTRLGVTNAFGPVVLSIADLSDVEFAPSPIYGVAPLPGDFRLMRGSDLVQHVVLVDYEANVFENLLVADDGSSSRELLRTVDHAGSIGDFSVSPNDQFVAVEVVPNVASSVSDGYPVDDRSTSVTTVIIDLSTGAQVKSVAGFALQW